MADGSISVESRVLQNQQKSMEEILMEIHEKDREYQFERRVGVLKTRSLNQKEQTLETDKKVEVLKDTPIGKEAFGVVCQILGAVAGGSGTRPGAGLLAFSQAFQTFASDHNKKNDAKIEGYNHHYQTLAGLISELTQLQQQADNAAEKNTRAIADLMQQIQQLAHLLFSNSQ